MFILCNVRVFWDVLCVLTHDLCDIYRRRDVFMCGEGL